MEQLSTETGSDLGKLIGAAAAGALLMYILDPERGQARRAHARHALRDARLHTGDAIGSALHSAQHQLDAARASAAAAYARADAAATRAGERLAEASREARDRASAALHQAAGRMEQRADAAHDRIEANTWEAQGRMDAVAERGRKAAQERADDAAMRTQGWLDQLSHALSPHSGSAQTTALLGGGALSLIGLMRRSPLGMVLALGGLALMARSGGGRQLAAMLGRGGRHIEVEKSIHIDASPDEVYDAWSNYDNFPRFMSNVHEVRDIGHRRSHWVVKGPGGAEYAWNAVMTEQSRPERMAWHSEPGSEIEQEGVVSFAPHKGGTLVTVRMAYSPPGGAAGHGIARLLGVDPKRQMDEDLANMKAFIERGITPYSAQHTAGSDRYLH